ncbi:hypothetical protein ABW636_19860 [Aquimarina sp. 2201CG1-2-11]|uniref:hypothetical protein n=1 Tax=Aquimarina discodermiae TaxID=3231043 RepID=UPI003462B8C0
MNTTVKAFFQKKPPTSNTRLRTSSLGHQASNRHRVIAIFFTITFLQTLIPYNQLWANNNGPKSPEASTFEPVDATDMVNLLTGDMSYVLPLLNVPSPEGGYPLALSYHAGIAMDQEASWVGLGWNLNPGAINRTLNKVPDDWYKVKTYNIMSSGANISYRGTLSVGFDQLGGSIGLYVNYSENRAFNGETEYSTDVGVTASVGIGGENSPLSINGSVGTDGVSVGLGFKHLNTGNDATGFNLNASLSQSFKNGSTTLSASGYGTGFSLNSSTGLSGSVLGRSVGINNSNNGSTAANLSTRNYGIVTPWVNLTLSIQKAWFFERDFTIHQGSLYGGDLKKVLSEALFDWKIDYDGYESINPQESFNESREGNFTNVSYDNYSVSGQGISGTIKPYVFEKNGYICNKEAILNGTTNEYSAIVGGYPIQNYFEKNVDGPSKKDVHFYFDNEFSSYLNIDSDNWKTDPLTIARPTVFDYSTNNNVFQTSLYNNDNDTYNDTYNDDSSRWKKGNYVETYTNEQINNNPELVLSTNAFDRNSVNIPVKGIGAYKITAIDGKTYHYTIPVYQHEQFSKTAHKDYSIEDNFTENQQLDSYATHWLLTGITGPDYIDVNNDNTLSKGDYGYWVSFDYGKWSDGYMWRTPTEGERVFENTKTYSWGIKDLYYLNKIKTRTHTALFIKGSRKDNYGSSISVPSQNVNDFKRYEDVHYKKRVKGSDGYWYFNGIYKNRLSPYGLLGAGRSDYDINYNVKKHKTLKLDKIIIVKNNSEYSNVSSSNVSQEADKNIGRIQIKTEFRSYDTGGKLISTVHETIHDKSWKGEYYKNVLDAQDIEKNAPNIYDDALEVINFNYDENYPLATATPNSTATSKGRLTLTSVDMAGKKGKSLIPPYKFDYYSKSAMFDKDNVDPWGYYENKPAVWSLNEITTPTGGKVSIEYEEDVYREIVKTNKVFSDKLKFKFTVDNKGDKYVHLSNIDNSTDKVDFREHFDTNSNAYVDVLYWRHPKGKAHRMGDVAKYCPVTSVNENLVVFKIPNVHTSPDVRRGVNCKKNLWVFYNRVEHLYNQWYTKKDENSCGDPRTTSDGTRMRYKFYSNKSNDGVNNGGGLRVKKLSLSNDNNETFESHYTYNNPITNENSGTTPYAPAHYTKNIPFLSELPAPYVLYQYVNVDKYTSNNKLAGSTRYKFNTIQNFRNYGNGFMMDDFLSLREYQDIDKNDVNLLIPTAGAKDTEGKNPERVDINFTRHRLEDNTSSIGALLHSKQYNSKNQLISSTENEYMLDSNRQGFVQETFKKVKLSIQSGRKAKYFVNASSKLKKLKVLKHSKITQGNFSFITSPKNFDPFTGKALEEHKISSDGTIHKTRNIAAYTLPEYSGELDKDANGIPDGYGMGSKVDNPTNKNMLIQQAINLTQIKGSRGQWKTIGADIITWNKDWSYRDYLDRTFVPRKENEKIWRTHKTFAWKGPIENDGSYAGYLGDFDSFNWEDTNNQSNDKWINTSSINLYSHHSAVLEASDINGNQITTKMTDNQTKIAAVCNTSYHEMFYSGAEYQIENTKHLDFGVIGSKFRNSTMAHTGNYSLKLSEGDKGFLVFIRHSDPSQIKKYKISVWVNKENANKARLHINGENKFFNGERLLAGNWILLNHYEELPSYADIHITAVGGTVYADDFRVHPIQSKMTSYVYNEWDELTYILGSNNLATRYEYDDVGRLHKTYTEVVNTSTITGGFKEISKNTYNYKNQQ